MQCKNSRKKHIQQGQRKWGENQTSIGLYFFYEPCKKLAYIRYETKMSFVANNYNILMPLQINIAIESLKTLHHKLLTKVVNFLAIHYISHFIIYPPLDGVLKEKVLKL
jgi:hypothetical protein